MASARGSQFPIKAAQDWKLFVVGMGENPRQREKASPEGEVTYSTGCLLVVQGKDGNTRVDKSASIATINPAQTYELGKQYVGKGRVFVQPYENNGRIAYSILAEELVALQTAPAASPVNPAGQKGE